jgi:translation initiation factor 2B subunit (eIF-2B alpha/beta/delta family)
MMSILSVDGECCHESCELLEKTATWAIERLSAGEADRSVTVTLQRLADEHPCSGLLQNFNRFFQKIPANPARVQAWLEMCQKHQAAAAAFSAAHMEKFDSMLIYGGGLLMQRALQAMTRPATVFVASSPVSPDGIRFAEHISGMPHRTYLVLEMAAFSTLDRVDCIFSGCSALTPRGIVHKIGAAAVCAAAKAAGKKVYFVATSEMKLDEWRDESLLCQGPRSEIYAGGNGRIRVENYRFDLTPNERTDGVFLETGLTLAGLQ